jgi:hypothetical protein
VIAAYYCSGFNLKPVSMMYIKYWSVLAYEDDAAAAAAAGGCAIEGLV